MKKVQRKKRGPSQGAPNTRTSAATTARDVTEGGTKRRFFYKASAAALGGRIVRPFNELIEVQASAALPCIGGYGCARVDDFRYRDIVSFTTACSAVAGSARQGIGITVYDTLATVLIEGINVQDVVTAEKVVSRLTWERWEHSDESKAWPVGSEFVKLRIAGVLVQPTPRTFLFQCSTVSELEKGLDGGGQPRVLVTSIFESPKVWGTDLEKVGCELGDSYVRVPGFGTIFVGEYFITRHSRRLSMLRIDMGSPLEGEIQSGDVGGNGHLYP